MVSALLVVDVQTGLIEEHPYQVSLFLETVEQALRQARARQIEVIYVRHHDDELPMGSSDWKIYNSVAPQADEVIIDKAYNSAFKETALQAYLERKGVERLFIVGMATDYCIDTTIKVAFELGYEVCVPQGGTTRPDNGLISADLLVPYYEKLWHNRFAQVLPLERLFN